MLKIKSLPLYFLLLGCAVTVANATPVSAQQVTIINGANSYPVSQPPTVGNYIYGSPISTPIPVNPVTGLPLHQNDYLYPYGYNWGHSTLVNPILVNPNIRNSTLINPVIVNDSRRYRPLRERSRVIFHSPIFRR